eukprot:251263-Rhodomonas_salina.2
MRMRKDAPSSTWLMYAGSLQRCGATDQAHRTRPGSVLHAALCFVRALPCGCGQSMPDTPLAQNVFANEAQLSELHAQERRCFTVGNGLEKESACG